MRFLKKVQAADKLEDMKVANVEYDNWGDEDDPASDWSILNKEAAFSHREASEFIVALAGNIPKLSSEAMDIIAQAKKEGFKYVCFYA